MWWLVDHLSRDHRPNLDQSIGGGLSRRIIDAVEPALLAHGITPANRSQRGPAVVWCSPVERLQVVDQDFAAVDCTDLWVEVDAGRNTIAVHVEGKDLARFVSGTGSMFKPANPVSLGEQLDGALSKVASLLDGLCSEVIVIQTQQDHRDE